ncbi:hypothetical protein RND81_14G166500 [Saponaria officinalis]|uniref:Regulator of Vps4 activity in the MVB pathway protein n=1 Tax=Saponaria officinalis TaxID=3572 RepID=A0AAW1GYP2_SAPOF
MLDGLLHRNTFRGKCKTALNRTKTRLEVIKKKKNATQKFLKKDIADLLKNNHDRIAYSRVEGIYNEFNLASCYDFIEQCCTCVSEHLKQLHKERECPEECKVAVSSLVYAAARFADLPELRDLRHQFNEKYGKSLEPFVSKEFVEKLKPKPPTMEMKLQLMQEIAQEFSMTWDSLPLQQQLHTESDNPVQLGSGIGASDKMGRSRSTVGRVKAKQGDCSKLINEEQKVRTRRHNSCSGFNKDISEILQQENSKNTETSLRSDAENNPYRKPFTNRIVSAPYVIPDEYGTDTRNDNISSENKEDNDPNLKDKNDDVLFSKAKPRPRSVRTKFLKSSASSMTSSRLTSSSEHEITVRESKSAKNPQQRRIDIFSDEEDEEEYYPGKFRTTYSTKRPHKTPNTARNLSFPTSPEKEDNETPKSALPPPPGKRRYLFADTLSSSSPGMDSDGQSGTETPSSSSGRSKFLPPDYVQQPESPGEREIVSPIRNVKSDPFINGHVHPKMPSFDELAERIAALRKM